MLQSQTSVRFTVTENYTVEMKGCKTGRFVDDAIITLDDDDSDQPPSKRIKLEDTEVRKQRAKGKSKNGRSQKKCAECGQLFSDKDELEGHIVADHLEWMRYKCAYCPMIGMPTLSFVSQHQIAAHPNKPPMIKYCRNAQKEEEVDEILMRSLFLSTPIDGNNAQLQYSSSSAILNCSNFPSPCVNETASASPKLEALPNNSGAADACNCADQTVISPAPAEEQKPVEEQIEETFEQETSSTVEVRSKEQRNQCSSADMQVPDEKFFQTSTPIIPTLQSAVDEKKMTAKKRTQKETPEKRSTEGGSKKRSKSQPKQPTRLSSRRKTKTNTVLSQGETDSSDLAERKPANHSKQKRLMDEQRKFMLQNGVADFLQRLPKADGGDGCVLRIQGDIQLCDQVWEEALKEGTRRYRTQMAAHSRNGVKRKQLYTSFSEKHMEPDGTTMSKYPMTAGMFAASHAINRYAMALSHFMLSTCAKRSRWAYYPHVRPVKACRTYGNVLENQPPIFSFTYSKAVDNLRDLFEPMSEFQMCVVVANALCLLRDSKSKQGRRTERRHLTLVG